jgi:signal transduction histidine kinase
VQNLKVVITVTDNGKGMTPAVQRRVFAPGFSTREGGWGLGLVLVKRIVDEYHGGSVDVAWTEPGRGSTLRIRLKTR